MKKFKIPCDFGDQKAPFDLYIGEPGNDIHPLFFQAAWLIDKRGGIIPSEVMESFAKLQAIASENNVSFEDLCMYALAAESNSPSSSQPGEVNPIIVSDDAA